MKNTFADKMLQKNVIFVIDVKICIFVSYCAITATVYGRTGQDTYIEYNLINIHTHEYPAG